MMELYHTGPGGSGVGSRLERPQLILKGTKGKCEKQVRHADTPDRELPKVGRQQEEKREQATSGNQPAKERRHQGDK